jgi:hypothetical protein
VDRSSGSGAARRGWPTSAPAPSRSVPTLQLLQAAARLPIHNALDPLRAASLGQQGDDALEACMVVEYAGPDERRAQPVEEVPNTLEGRRQRLERVDPAAVFDTPDPHSADAEGTFPVVRALSLPWDAEGDDDASARGTTGLKAPLGYDATEWIVTATHHSPQIA